MADKHFEAWLSLSGSDWYIRDDADGIGEVEGFNKADVPATDWIPACVPGNIQADLEAAHTLNPLWYGAGDPRLADVAKKDWWYRRDFELPWEMEGARLKLIFDGVDYACDVWLNGQRLGRNAGMFRRFGFDVADLVKPGEGNQLALKIDRIPTELAHILEASDGPLSGGGENYPREWGPDFFVYGINQARQLLKDLKSPTNYGWDWGVNVYTIGIWQDVRLEASGAARIEWIQAATELNDDHRRARVRVKLEIDSLSALPVSAILHVDGHGGFVETSVEAKLQAGGNTLTADLWLDEPALWWPNGQGDQPLYRLQARLLHAPGGELLDESTIRFGVRDICWEQVEGAPDDFVNPYQLVVNGRPIRMLGSNLIPPDLLFGRMNERGCRLIRLAAGAGMNTVRVWGGGVFPTEDMFDLADELGIMLSQEFPMSSCRPETDAPFLGNLETTVRGLVKRYRNHPCIIEWSGGNEMWWHQGDDHTALQLLARIVAEEDTRLFRATCPIQGARHSPWHYDPATHYAHYDNEQLMDTGWRRGENKMMRYGEFGCHSLAHLEVWQREIPPADQWPAYDENNPVLIRKNVVQAVFTKEHWLLKSILESLFGPIKTLEALVAAGQYLGAQGLRYAVDALRRRGRQVGGILTWVLNEPWPNGGGPYLVDYDGRPLMIYDFQKQALSPISLSLKFESNLYDAAGLEAELWLVSDAPQLARDLRWRWTLRDFRGGALSQSEGRTSISPLESLQLGAIKSGPLDQDAAGPLLVELQLLGASGTIITERIHLFGLADRPAPLAGFLPGAKSGSQRVAQTVLELVSQSHRRDEDGDVLHLELANCGGMTALFCEPHPLLAYRTDLDIEDNHIFIPPGEARRITIRASADSREGLTLAQTGWRISCWNANDVMIPPSEDLLFSIGRRDAMTREFLGYDDPARIDSVWETAIEGVRPDPAALPFLMDADRRVRFIFEVGRSWEQPARLRLHTADQSRVVAAQIEVKVNGRRFAAALPTGLGIQKREPAHLAFPETATIYLPAGTLAEGENTIEVLLRNKSWFTWDAIDLIRCGD
jgi:beta-mannosidase